MPDNHSSASTTDSQTGNPHLHELGKVTVFYIPSHKLDDPVTSTELKPPDRPFMSS